MIITSFEAIRYGDSVEEDYAASSFRLKVITNWDLGLLILFRVELFFFRVGGLTSFHLS